ncbi:YbhB/YbcL family Raf kinase inhibitor-like protein [Thermoleophilia bacterium SCSIO 60948]|nr:YbhB/YbcL family Raf kinase inhibitor-like protein [Thermoleophilia bacterium SCSIO 60948]
MPQELNVQDLKVSSEAFDGHKRIPDKHTTEGEDVSPPISWSGVPDGTKSFAIVCHDPDAPLVDGFTHWVGYGISGDTTSLGEGEDPPKLGVHTMGEQAYMGPAPPPGHGPHHYYFWVYALDEDLNLEPGLDRRALLEAIEDHVIEQARLIGTYDR